MSERVDVNNADPTTVATQLKAAVPFLTVHPVGRTLELIGAPEDIAKAKDLLKDLDVAPAPTVPTVTETISLTNVKAPDVQNVINNTYGGKNVAQAVGETKLVINAPQADLDKIRELVTALDRSPEANLRYAVYHVKFADARTLSISLQRAMQNITIVTGPEAFRIPKTQLNLVTGGAIQVGGNITGGSTTSITLGNNTSTTSNTTDQTAQQGVGGAGQQQLLGLRSRTLIIGGTDEAVKAALQLLEKIDVPTPQVALDVKVVSTNPSTTQNLGLQWLNGTDGTPGQISTQVVEGPYGNNPGVPGAFSGTPNPNANTLFPRNSFGFGSLARLPITFQVNLNAFFQRTDVRILAKPTITALDNEEGVIFVGQTNRLLTAVISGGATNIVTQQIVEIPTGIILQMTPRIIDDETIQLRVHPIVSEVSGVVASTGLFNSLVREADTTVRVRSGETIVIGGLLQDEDTKILSKIPILGDIPLIGQFFRNHSHTHNRQEVLVFVTPHLLKE